MRGARVLDVCTGSGVVAVGAALGGAAEVVAVDVSLRAVLTAQLNALLNGVRVDGRRGDLLEPVAGERFDLITSNPPYLPGPQSLPTHGKRRAWEGGPDGRAFLDRLIAAAPAYLHPGGVLLLTHSSVCGLELTSERMRAAGLRPEVLSRHRGRFGPLLRARALELEARGLLAPGQREEDIAILKAQRAGPRAEGCGS
jgi:release factor glutamine methyltransferase